MCPFTFAALGTVLAGGSAAVGASAGAATGIIGAGSIFAGMSTAALGFGAVSTGISLGTSLYGAKPPLIKRRQVTRRSVYATTKP